MLGTAGTWCTYTDTYTPHLISPLRSCSELLTDLLTALLRPGGGPKANVGATAGDHGRRAAEEGRRRGRGKEPPLLVPPEVVHGKGSLGEAPRDLREIYQTAAENRERRRGASTKYIRYVM